MLIIIARRLLYGVYFMNTKIKEIIFDFDGTLIDSEPIHMESWNAVLRQYGFIYSYNEYLRFVGKGDNNLASVAVAEKCLIVSPGELVNQKKYCYESLIGKVKLRDGVIELLNFLTSHEITICIASSEKTEIITDILKRENILKHFFLIIGSDQISLPKPNPEVYNNILAATKVKASESIAIEDSPDGVLAAYRAGITVIAAPNEYTKNFEFELADYKIQNFVECISLLKKLIIN